MTKIDTYREFMRSVVEPDFQEFMADKGNLRKAWHCAGSLFHLHDWVYEAHKSRIDAKYTFHNDKTKQTRPVSSKVQFADSLGQTHPNFELIRGIANASKHFKRRQDRPSKVNPPGMPSYAANTYVSGTAFQPGAFQSNVFQTGRVKLQSSPTDIEFAGIAQSVFNMWNQLFEDEKW